MQKPIGELKELPSTFLAKLVVGQRIESIALTTAAANELLKLRVQQSIFDIKTPWPIKQGQTVQLEVATTLNNKLVLNVVSPETTKLTAASKTSQISVAATPQQVQLQVGQKIPVEVVSKPSNGLVVVAPVITTNKTSPQPTALPTKMEIDISRLAKPLLEGDKLTLNVIKLNPLSVSVSAIDTKTVQQERVVERIKQLLPQQQTQTTALRNVVDIENKIALPEKLTTSITHLVKNIVDSSTITQPDTLKQAIQNSGVFLERHLLQQSKAVDNDFKANLQRLIVNLQTVINEFTQQQQATGKTEQRSLPPAIQAALANLAATPNELSKIPEHIRQTLASTGVKPAQLLTVLLGQAVGIELPEELRVVVEQQRQGQTSSSQPQNLSSRLVTVELVLLRELLRDVESTATKIQLNQLGMARDTDPVSPSAVWMLDVPLKDKERIDLIQMRIEQNKHNPFEKEGDIWEVDLRIDTVNLGPMNASISMHEQDVKVVLKVQKQSSSDLLEDNVSLLQENLHALGVTVSYLRCMCESTDADINMQALKQQLVNSLVDISV